METALWKSTLAGSLSFAAARLFLLDLHQDCSPEIDSTIWKACKPDRHPLRSKYLHCPCTGMYDKSRVARETRRTLTEGILKLYIHTSQTTLQLPHQALPCGHVLELY